MDKIRSDRKEYVVSEIKRKWNDVLFDSACCYDDGALALTFCVCTNIGRSTLVTVVFEKNDTCSGLLERLNERIAWTFASAHFAINVR